MGIERKVCVCARACVGRAGAPLDSASAEGVGDSARRSSASQSTLVARACSGTNAGARIRNRAKKSSCVYLTHAQRRPAGSESYSEYRIFIGTPRPVRSPPCQRCMLGIAYHTTPRSARAAHLTGKPERVSRTASITPEQRSWCSTVFASHRPARLPPFGLMQRM